MYGRLVALHDDKKYGTTRILFASTYTAKQMKTMYYSHSYNTLYTSASTFGYLDDFCVIKKIFTR